MSKSLSTLRRIKNDFDWESYLNDHYTIKRNEGRNGTELRICCPNCLEREYKCYVNSHKRVFNCFKCDFRTGTFDLFDFVALTESISRHNAIMKLLQEHVALTPEEEDFKDYLSTPIPGTAKILEVDVKYLSELPEQCEKLLPEEGNVYWEYVKNRGFTERDLASTNLHYVADKQVPVHDSKGKYKGNLGQRIVFPVYGAEGKLVSYLARTVLEEVTPKYFNSPESDLSKTLWPYSKPYGKDVIVVEGIIDALTIRRVPQVSTYATFGKSMSREQIYILKNWGVEDITVWYDRKDAKKQIIDLVDILKLKFKNVFVLDLEDWPKDKDAGYFLSNPDGTAIIKEALSKRINTDSTWEYARWKMVF